MIWFVMLQAEVIFPVIVSFHLADPQQDFNITCNHN